MWFDNTADPLKAARRRASEHPSRFALTNIVDFDTLDDNPLGEVVERLRQVQGSGWKEIEDSASELEQLRQGSDGMH